jgi:hypothetical protein
MRRWPLHLASSDRLLDKARSRRVYCQVVIGCSETPCAIDGKQGFKRIKRPLHFVNNIEWISGSWFPCISDDNNE